MEKRLKPFDVCIVDCKEKWGFLKVIYNFEGSEQDSEIVDQIVKDAEDKSTITCESCGEPGEQHKTKNGWLKTLCPKCLTVVNSIQYSGHGPQSKTDNRLHYIVRPGYGSKEMLIG